MITDYAQILKKLPSWIYKAAAQSWIDKDFPRHLFIETTAACNLSCDYCPREKNKSHMDFELFKRLVVEASLYGSRSFSLHLFGEPLLYPKAFEAIEFIKQCNKAHTILLTSNGTLFERYCGKICNSGITKLIWSWRPEAKFSEETKRKLKKWGRLTVRMIKGVTPQSAFEEWANWPNLEIRDLHNYGGEIERQKFGLNAIAGKRYPCYHLWYAPAVAWNGNLLMCCSDPHQKEVLGKFPTLSISQAWKKMNGIREAHLKGQFTGICEKCDVWKSYPNIFFGWQHTGSSSSENS